MRIAPSAPNQISMPSQQRLGLHEESPPTMLRQQPTQPRKQCSIAWLQERAGHLATQHGHLVVKHHDLDGEIVLLPSTQTKKLEQPHERHVEEGQSHRAV
jgi:hypothetical protein